MNKLNREDIRFLGFVFFSHLLPKYRVRAVEDILKIRKIDFVPKEKEEKDENSLIRYR